jgi:hypothetical protein
MAAAARQKVWEETQLIVAPQDHVLHCVANPRAILTFKNKKLNVKF